MTIRNLTHLAVAAILLASAGNVASANAEDGDFRVSPGQASNAGHNAIQINPRFEYKRPGRSGAYVRPNVVIAPPSAGVPGVEFGYIFPKARTEFFGYGYGPSRGAGIRWRF